MPILKEEVDLLSANYQARAEKLKCYAEQFETDTKLAALLGFSPARLHRLIRKQDVPFTEKLARAIEMRLNKPFGWLDEAGDGTILPGKFSVPIYFLDDLVDLAQHKPAGFYPFITQINNAYFVQITTTSYAPWIIPGSLLLINPHEKDLLDNQIYLLSYQQKNQLLRAVIRKLERDKLINLATHEADNLKNWYTHGKCELIIVPTTH